MYHCCQSLCSGYHKPERKYPEKIKLKNFSLKVRCIIHVNLSNTKGIKLHYDLLKNKHFHIFLKKVHNKFCKYHGNKLFFKICQKQNLMEIKFPREKC